MTRPLKIGNAHGFWGDRLDAPAELLRQAPDLDYLTLDFLAEVSMSILVGQRAKDPEAGYPKDFLEIVQSLVPYWSAGGRCRLVTNAGGLNPLGCAQACRQILDEGNCGSLSVGMVAGDDVFELIKQEPESVLAANLDTGESLTIVLSELRTANAYVGADVVTEVLEQGANVVVTGRVADPSLTVAACREHFKWSVDDWDKIAGATIAGHLLECGTQACGGISTDWIELTGQDRIGFPIVEVQEDGSCIVTKPPGTGGAVTERTVKEQLMYEIGDPGNYLSPDVTVSFLSLSVKQVGPDRVAVTGAMGSPPPPSYKVSATYKGGFRSSGQLTLFGTNAVAKAKRAGEVVLSRLEQNGVKCEHSRVECLGAGACVPGEIVNANQAELTEVVLRVSVADSNRENVQRFTRELMPLVTSGPQGLTGYAEGRPRVHPLIKYWPCLIERDRVQVTSELLAGNGSSIPTSEIKPEASPPTALKPYDEESLSEQASLKTNKLESIAYARSGDKGIHANVGVLARRPEAYETMSTLLTVAKVADYFGLEEQHVERYDVPNLGSINFILRTILSDPLRIDVQGKTLGQVLLQMPLDK